MLVVGRIFEQSSRLATGDCIEIVDNAESSTDLEKGSALQALLETGGGAVIDSSKIGSEPSERLTTETHEGGALLNGMDEDVGMEMFSSD